MVDAQLEFRISRQITIDDRAAAVLSRLSAYKLAPILAEQCGQPVDEVRRVLSGIQVDSSNILRAKKAAESVARKALGA
jgi:hypothetical protein